MKMKKSEKSGQCGICGKELIVPAHIDLGIGPVCAKKISDNWDALEEMAFSEQAFNVDHYRFVCGITEDGSVGFNIKQQVVAHSHTGMGWGKDGRGGQDYALNILLRVTDTETAVAMYGLFHTLIVEKLPPEGGEITLGQVEDFIEMMLPRCTKTIEKLKSRELFEEKSNGKAN